MTIYVVVAADQVWGAYYEANLAETHARTITGAHVAACELLTTLAESAVDDLDMEAWIDVDDTPVVLLPK